MNNLLLISLESIGGTITQCLSKWGIWYHVLYNFFGLIAVILKIIEVQLKNRSKRLVIAMCLELCWIIYFLLCGKLTACITCLVLVIQSLIFLQREKHKWADSLFWLFFFLGIQLGICVWNVLSGEGVLVLLSVFAGVFATLAYFVKNDRLYRCFMFISLSFWVANSVVGTFFTSSSSRLWTALVSDVFGSTSAFIAIIRYDIIIFYWFTFIYIF